MPYASAEQFAAKYGSDYSVRLLAGLEPGASKDPAVLDKLLGGTAPSGPEEEALQRGIDRLQRQLGEQSDFADTYLMRAATLPLEQAAIDASPLMGYVCHLTRHALATKPGFRTRDVVDDYERVVAWLRDVSAGRAGLPQLPRETGSTRGRFAFGGNLTASVRD